MTSMLSAAIQRITHALSPTKSTDATSHVESEVLHLAMLEGKVAVALDASGEGAMRALIQLVNQGGITKLVLVAPNAAKMKEMLDRFPQSRVRKGEIMAVQDMYKPKENLDALLKRVKREAGLEESVGVVSILEYQSTTETFSGLGNAVDFEELGVSKL